MSGENEKKWNKMYELAKAYYEYHGNLFVPTDFNVKGYNNELAKLGQWISVQRTNYNSGKMPQDRIKKLESIGMIWKRKTVKEDFRRYEEYNDWNKMYELAKTYYTINGDLNNLKKIQTDGYRLDYWISNQKQDYKKGKLSNEQIEKLNSIGIIWTDKYQKRSSDTGAWDKMYELAKAYYNYHGNLDISRSFKVEGYDNEKVTQLGGWINNQRVQYRLGKLSEERIEKLNDIGMIWEKGRSRK